MSLAFGMSSSSWCARGLTRVVRGCHLRSGEQSVGWFVAWRVWPLVGAGRWLQGEDGDPPALLHPHQFTGTHQSQARSRAIIVQFCFITYCRKKEVVSFQRRLVKMPEAACFWHFQLLLNNSLASVTANVDLKAVVHFSTQMLSRQTWVLTNIFWACPRQVKMSF